MYTISDKEKATIDTLQNFSDYLHLSDFFSDVIRQTIWGLIKFLNYILSNMQKAMKDVLGFLDISKNAEVISFLNTYRPVFYAIGMIVFVITVYLLIFKPDANFFQPIKSALIAFGLIIALPIIFSAFSDVAQTWAGVMTSQSASQSIIQNNTYDVLALDQKVKWDTSKLSVPFNTNYLSLPVPTYDVNGNQTNKEAMKTAEKNTLNLVDTKEVVNPKDYTHYLKADELSKKGVDVLSNSITNGIGDNGETELKLKKLQAWYKFDQYYYRFTWNTKAILFYMISAIVVMAFLIFKLIKIEYELGFTYLLFNSTAPTDLQGKRNWQMFISMVNSFATIIMVLALAQIYDIFYSIIDQTPIFQNNWILEVVAKIALILAVIDGPNIFQQIFGVDAGLQSTWKTAAGFWAGGRAFMNLPSGLKRFTGGKSTGQAGGVGALLNKTGGVLNGAMDMVAGTENNPIRNTGKALKNMGSKASNGLKDFKDNGGVVGQLAFEGKSNLAKNGEDGKSSQGSVSDQGNFNEALDNLSDRNRPTPTIDEESSPDLRRNVNLQNRSTGNPLSHIVQGDSVQVSRSSPIRPQTVSSRSNSTGAIPRPNTPVQVNRSQSVPSHKPIIDQNLFSSGIETPPSDNTSDFSSLFDSLPTIEDD